MQDIQYAWDRRHEGAASDAVEGDFLTVVLLYNGVDAVGNDEDVVGVSPADAEGAGIGILTVVKGFEIQEKLAAGKDERVPVNEVPRSEIDDRGDRHRKYGVVHAHLNT